MATTARTPAQNDPAAAALTRGATCLLRLSGCHFQVTIIEAEGDRVRVTVPGTDYPIEGSRAYLEFHDDSGFYYYITEVTSAPGATGPGIALRREADLRRNVHRTACRVLTDLTVQVRDQSHVRRYNAALINLSLGGALIETEAPFDFSTGVELELALPGERAHPVECQIVEVAEPTFKGSVPVRQFNLRFLGLGSGAADSIARYVRQRLQETASHG